MRPEFDTWRAGTCLVIVGVAVAVADTARRLRRARSHAAGLRRDLDHTAVVGDGGGEPLRLVVLGDSSAAGDGCTRAEDALPRRLALALHRPVAVTCLASSGAATRDVLREQLPALPAVDAVAVVVGVNDAIGRHPPQRVEADTRALLDGVRAAAPDARIALLACPDVSRAPGLPAALLLPVRRLTRRTAAAQARGARAADVPVVHLPAPDGPSVFGPDRFHPGPAALDAMAAALADALR